MGLFSLILISYSLGAGCLWYSLWDAKPRGGYRWYAMAIIGVGLACQLLSLHHAIDTPLGQHLGALHMLNLTLTLWLLFVWLAAFAWPLQGLLLLLLPINALGLTALMYWPNTGHYVPLSNHPFELIHILSAIFAYALLGVAALQALSLAIQRSYLHRAALNRALNLTPPLEAMHTLLLRVWWVAFICLTIAVFWGMITFYETRTFSLFKAISTGLAWGVSAVALGIHARSGLSLRSSILCVGAAWLCLSVGYFGVKLIGLMP